MLIYSGEVEPWRQGSVQYFVRFDSSGVSLCERLRNAVFALLWNGAISPTRSLLAGWTGWNENNTKLTVNKLIVLAHIYGVCPEQLLRSMYSVDTRPMLLRQFPGPNGPCC
jgi:hypothetical protein